jgi:hypothetical protein
MFSVLACPKVITLSGFLLYFKLIFCSSVDQHFRRWKRRPRKRNRKWKWIPDEVNDDNDHRGRRFNYG